MRALDIQLANASGDIEGIASLRHREEMALKDYYVIGGMPEVVSEFADNGNYTSAHVLQNQIIEGYTRDFIKHVPSTTFPKILEAWQSIPAHLSHENKKFVFWAHS